MSPLELRGRTIVRFVAGTWLVLLIGPMILNLVTACDIARELGGIPHNFVGLVAQLVMGFLIALPLVCLYRGHAWARWVTVVLLSLAVFGGFSYGIHGVGGELWIGAFALLFAMATVGALLIPPSVRAFYRASAGSRGEW